MRLQKIVLCILFFISIAVAHAQIDISATRSRFGIGVNGGATIGDYKDVYSPNVGVDIIYLYSVSSRFHIGASTGLANYFYKEGNNEVALSGDFEDVQLLPITASIRLSPFRNFLGGTDVGYAIGLDDNNNGGFYISPRVTYLFAGRMPIFLGYRMINLDSDLNSIQFGIGFILE